MKLVARARIRVVLAFVAVVPMIVAVVAIGALARSARHDESDARGASVDLDAFIALRNLQASVDAEMYLYFGWTEYALANPGNQVTPQQIRELLAGALEESSIDALAKAKAAAFTPGQIVSIARIQIGIEEARVAFLASDYLSLMRAGDNVQPGFYAVGAEAEIILARHDYSWVALQEQATYISRLSAEVYGLASLALTSSSESERQYMAIAGAETDAAYERFEHTMSDAQKEQVALELNESPLFGLRELTVEGAETDYGTASSVVMALGALEGYFSTVDEVRRESARVISDEAAADAAAASQRYRLFILGAVLIVVVPAVSVTLVGRSLSRRLEKVAEVAESLSNGEMGARIEDESGNDEIAVVSRAFNDVSTTMAASYQQIRLLADGRYNAEILDHELPGPLGKTIRLALRRLGNSSAELAHLASHDRLTGLLDRRGLDQELTSWPAGAGSIALLDLDGFKAVNDTYGHGAGDAVLVAVAKRLAASCREEDLVARLGGDEFVVATKTVDLDHVRHLAERIVESVCQPVAWGDTQLHVSASVGYTQFSPEEDYATSLKRADAAMYAAKDAGKDQAIFAPLGG